MTMAPAAPKPTTSRRRRRPPASSRRTARMSARSAHADAFRVRLRLALKGCLRRARYVHGVGKCDPPFTLPVHTSIRSRRSTA
jgi:hypothetical protein